MMGEREGGYPLTKAAVPLPRVLAAAEPASRQAPIALSSGKGGGGGSPPPILAKLPSGHSLKTAPPCQRC
jgi:hypothetical protein